MTHITLFKVKRLPLNTICGFTLIELLLAIAVIGILVSIAAPAYQNYMDRVSISSANDDIAVLQFTIDDYKLTTGKLPDSLADIGMDGMEDPWGNPYVYANHNNVPPGHRRKDHSQVPINTDYDLYSNGPDGRTAWPLTAHASKDDIVRARDGKFIGNAEDY